MSITTKTAIAELKHRPGRLVAVMLAITIGSLFAVATTVFSSTAGRAVEVVVSESLQNADVVVAVAGSPAGEKVDEYVATMKSVPGVQAVAPTLTAVYRAPGAGPLSATRVTSVIDDDKLAYEKLREGRFAETPTEITIDPTTATDGHAGIGDEITLKGMADDEVTYTIVGITEPNPTTVKLAGAVSWVTADALKHNPNAWVSSYLIRVDGDPQQVANQLNQVLPDGMKAAAGEQARQDLVQEVSGGTLVISALLGTFAVIALAVAAIVIANTFAILLAQRRRQIALQRLVGATSKQMSRQILLEALLIGIAGTVIGAALGLLAGYFGARIFGVAAGGFSASPLLVAIACAATVLATVAAAYVPIRKACKTAPIEALRPSESELQGRGLPRWRMILSLLLVVGGIAIMAFGAFGHSIITAAFGGMLSVIGLLLGAQVIVVGMARVMRPIGDMFGMPGRIASRDVTRHAGRATNTVIAIIVGIGLISMIQVAASIVRTTALEAVEDSEAREAIEAIIDIMTNVATGLLTVAAIIAIVGIANTLALSVIERARENGLMRALGMQKGQLRSMISVEAVILSLIGGIVGVVLGIFYGAVAAYAEIGDEGPMVWDIPWGRLALFLGFAVVGGLVASVLPAIRSGRVSPVEALATA